MTARDLAERRAALSRIAAGAAAFAVAPNLLAQSGWPEKTITIITPFGSAVARQTNGFLEALNGLFQAAKRRARGFTHIATIRTVIFLIAGKLDFSVLNPHAGQPT